MDQRIRRLMDLHDSVAELKAEFDSNKILSQEPLVSSHPCHVGPTSGFGCKTLQSQANDEAE